MTLSRRAVMLGLSLGLAATRPGTARASSKPLENYVKLSGLAIEYWDQNGLFHAVNIDMSVVFKEEAKLDKSVADLIVRALSSMPWEEFSRGNPAATVKAVALDIIRKQPGGEKAIEVLIGKLVIR